MSVENVLIVGSGGREHALAWKMRTSPLVGNIYVAPGNGGTQDVGTNVDIASDDVCGLAQFASVNHIGLTVVGPEVPLERGIVDVFTQDKLTIFGPTQQAARLETDKAWATDFMDRHKIPHPTSRIFTDFYEAFTYVSVKGAKNIVIKASGLAGGKGVVLPNTTEDALHVLKNMMQMRIFGEAGHTVVIQERLYGLEISVMALSDGKTVVTLLPAQDHKRIFDGDKGPNTGGMGAYAPVPFVTPELLEEIHRTILQPTIDGMREEGYPFKGVLYAGLMLTSSGSALEFNVRFGDPETQPLMMLLSSDLPQLLHASIQGSLTNELVSFYPGAAACVVLAADGYPGHYNTGVAIKGLDQIHDPHVVIFHAGTCMKQDGLVTNGGRVLGVTAHGQTIEQALKRTYGAIGPRGVHFEGMQYRKDIGSKRGY